MREHSVTHDPANKEYPWTLLVRCKSFGDEEVQLKKLAAFKTITLAQVVADLLNFGVPE